MILDVLMGAVAGSGWALLGTAPRDCLETWDSARVLTGIVDVSMSERIVGAFGSTAPGCGEGTCCRGKTGSHTTAAGQHGTAKAKRRGQVWEYGIMWSQASSRLCWMEENEGRLGRGHAAASSSLQRRSTGGTWTSPRCLHAKSRDAEPWSECPLR
jgi:hypothetical protein